MELSGKRVYKDTLFRDLFGSEGRKENSLALYNALAGTNYDDPAVLEITTLDEVIYLNVKNDVSFLIGEEMLLWEHQSTKNPNMPLRGLLYFGRLYSKYVDAKRLDIYGKTLQKLPAPRYYVFYNGKESAPPIGKLRLSDAFEVEGDVEVVARVVNINANSMPEGLDACEPLVEYAEVVARVRYNTDELGLELGEAIDHAVASCIDDGILAEYLRDRRAEVRDMFMTEYDEEKWREIARESGFQEGREEGLAQGLDEGRAKGIEEGRAQGIEQEALSNIKSLMETMGWNVAEAMDALKVSEGVRAGYLEKLG